MSPPTASVGMQRVAVASAGTLVGGPGSRLRCIAWAVCSSLLIVASDSLFVFARTSSP